MPKFEITITEMTRSIELPSPPDAPTPQVRIQVWRGEATDADEATNKTWQQWDDAYGDGQRPDAFRVDVRQV